MTRTQRKIPLPKTKGPEIFLGMPMVVDRYQPFVFQLIEFNVETIQNFDVPASSVMKLEKLGKSGNFLL